MRCVCVRGRGGPVPSKEERVGGAVRHALCNVHPNSAIVGRDVVTRDASAEIQMSRVGLDCSVTVLSLGLR
jgi:hypothetical protein